MLHSVLVSEAKTFNHPVQRVQPVDGVKLWLLDQAAAARLPKTY